MTSKHNLLAAAGAVLALIAVAAGAGSAQANVFDFTFTSGADSGTMDLTATLQGSAYAVTSITGSIDGSTITGLSSYGTADQLVFAAQPYVDYGGIGFSASNGNDYNLFSRLSDSSFTYYLCSSNINPSCGGADGAVATMSASGGTSVPEPATWAMMLIGMAGLGGAMRSRRRQFATIA